LGFFYFLQIWESYFFFFLKFLHPIKKKKKKTNKMNIFIEQAFYS